MVPHGGTTEETNVFSQLEYGKYLFTYVLGFPPLVVESFAYTVLVSLEAATLRIACLHVKLILKQSA